MTDLSIIQSLIDSEDQSMEFLLRRAGLDPAVDLEGCDLSHVDFGEFSPPVLNLKNCILENSDLTKLRPSTHLIVSGARTRNLRLPSWYEKPESKLQIRQRIDSLKSLSKFIFRFQPDRRLGEQVVKRLRMWRPVAIAFDSFSEQDAYASEVIAYINDYYKKSDNDKYGDRWAKFDMVLFENKSIRIESESQSPESLDKNFLKVFRNSRIFSLKEGTSEPTIGPYAKLYGDRSGKTIIVPEERSNFLATMQHIINPERECVLVFSGAPPLSQKLYESLSRRLPNLKFVLLYPRKSLEALIKNQDFLRATKLSVVECSNTITRTDIERFVQKWERLFPEIKLDSSTEEKISSFEGEHYLEMRKYLLARIFEKAKEKTKEKTLSI